MDKKVEVGVWYDNGEKGFGDRAWANVGSKENAAKLLDLTPEDIAALDKYGSIDKDVDGGTITIEAGWF